MARIHEGENGYEYEIDDIAILLDEDSFHGYQHRSTAHALMDWVGVLDPRDGLHFSHWRYDQPPEAFDEMMSLVKMIGTYILSDTPYEHIQAMFEQSHSLGDDDFDHLLEP